MSDNNNRLNPAASDNIFFQNTNANISFSPHKISLANSSNNEHNSEDALSTDSSQTFVSTFNNSAPSSASHISLNSSANGSEYSQTPIRLRASSSSQQVLSSSTKLFNHSPSNNSSVNNNGIKLQSVNSNGSSLTLHNNNINKNSVNQQFQNNSVQGQFSPSQQVPSSNNNAPLSTGKSIKETMKKPYSEIETMEEKDLKRVEYSNTRMYYLTKRVKEKVGMFPSTEIRAILQALALVAREDIIQNGFFIIPNIAVLKVLEKPARDSYNPYYKKIMHIDKHYILRAYPYPSLKRMIKKINNGEFYEEDEYIIHRDEKTGEYYIDIRGVLEDY